MAKKKSAARGGVAGAPSRIPNQVGATKQPSSSPVFPQSVGRVPAPLSGFRPTASAKKQQDLSVKSRNT